MTAKSTGGGRGLKGEPRITPAQRRRREDHVVLLSNLGYWSDQIARALAVSESTVNADRNARKGDLVRYGRGRHRTPRPLPPPAFDWKSEPEPEPLKPAYWLGPLMHLQSLRDYLQTNNARGQLAFNLDEARDCGDAGFRQEVSEVVADLAGRIDEFGEMLVSDDASATAKSIEGREDLREPGPPRPTVQPGEFKSLPNFGRGTIPARYHAALWQEWFAGHNILDVQIITKIATSQRVSPARIRLAATELLPYLRMWEAGMGRQSA